MDWQTAFTIALSINSMLLLALGSWFWSWKQGVDRDMRDSRDILVRQVAVLERLDEKLDDIKGVPDRVLTLEHHVATAEATIGHNSRRLADVEKEAMKDARTSLLFERLYEKFVGTPPDGFRAIPAEEKK